jgi:hypothetical protein
MPETITATYDNLVVAEEVIRDLVTIGCRPEDIDLAGGDDTTGLDLQSGPPAQMHSRISHLTVSVPDSLIEQVMTVIHQHNPHRIEGPNFQWRRSGTYPSYPF